MIVGVETLVTLSEFAGPESLAGLSFAVRAPPVLLATARLLVLRGVPPLWSTIDTLIVNAPELL